MDLLGRKRKRGDERRCMLRWWGLCKDIQLNGRIVKLTRRVLIGQGSKLPLSLSAAGRARSVLAQAQPLAGRLPACFAKVQSRLQHSQAAVFHIRTDLFPLSDVELRRFACVFALLPGANLAVMDTAFNVVVEQFDREYPLTRCFGRRVIDKAWPIGLLFKSP